MSQTDSRRDHLAALEQQLAALLRPLAPAAAELLIAGCFEDGAGGFAYRSTYVAGLGAGQPTAQELPALPAEVQSLLRRLRRAMADDPAIRSLWEVCKVIVPCQPDAEGQELAPLFYYGFPERAGDSANDEAYNLPTAEELQALLRGEAAAEVDDAPAPAAAPRAVAAPTAAPKPAVWVCTWCKQEYASARQPTSFEPGKCPRNPGKAHAWHKQ